MRQMRKTAEAKISSLKAGDQIFLGNPFMTNPLALSKAPEWRKGMYLLSFIDGTAIEHNGYSLVTILAKS